MRRHGILAPFLRLPVHVRLLWGLVGLILLNVIVRAVASFG